MSTTFNFPDDISVTINENDRYKSDLERERIIYANGQYWRIKEEMFSGGPFAVPTYIWDPYGPWRMASPWRMPAHYWNDLNLKHSKKQREILNQFMHKAEPRGEQEPMEDLMAVPIGTYVEDIKQIIYLTIGFGDKKLNYTVPIVRDEIYRIDYYEDATLKSIVGKVRIITIHSGKDYRGKPEIYCILQVDTSDTFDAYMHIINTKDIRYIKDVKEMANESLIINRCYVGPEEPENAEEYGMWVDPAAGIIRIRINSEWTIVNTIKPEETPEEGMYWKFNYKTCQWNQKEIPDKPTSIDPKIDFEFNEHDGKWVPYLIDDNNAASDSENDGDTSGS